MGTLLLQREREFEATNHRYERRSCSHPNPRLALLAPPGAVGDAAAGLLVPVLSRATLIRTTSVPPYGYGKNHGWTCIIRLTHASLAEAVADSLLVPPPAGEQASSLEQGAWEAGGQVEILALRQLVRWHCRISHVAAHTPVLTLGAAELLSDVHAALTRVLRFTGISAPAGVLFLNSFLGALAVPASMSDRRNSGGTETIITSTAAAAVARLRRAAASASRASKHATSSGGDRARARLDAALSEELGGLRRWPCRSLWVGGWANDMLARALAPNCTAPFVRCTVARDQCEQTAYHVTRGIGHAIGRPKRTSIGCEFGGGERHEERLYVLGAGSKVRRATRVAGGGSAYRENCTCVRGVWVAPAGRRPPATQRNHATRHES